ncbi:MAG: type II secretion system protein [bacterium]
MVIKTGFSLIELVVVIGLLSLLMLAISGTMMMSVVSSTRIRTTTKVKQAGNYAMDQISFMIRNAKSITNCNASTKEVALINPDGGQTTFSLSSSRIASVSATTAYLTPSNLTVSNYALDCSVTNLVKLSFYLKDSTLTKGNPNLYFETSINTRN